MPSWSLRRGATKLDNGSVRLEVWAPRARAVTARFNAGAAVTDVALSELPDHPGVFSTVVDDAARLGDYWYVIDGAGDVVVPDPVSRSLPQGVHGPTRVVDPDAFAWSDGEWRGLAMSEYVIYELHVGTFSDDGTFDGVIPHLADLKSLGVTAIELMPVAQFPGARNWGYDGVSLYAVQESYGGPEGLKRLVDAAHATGLAVVLDVVYNHLGPEGNYLDRFGPYFTRKYTTPWGSALNYDDADSEEVRRYIVDNALYWISEYHIDGLRLDAIHGIYDFSATHILQELTEAVHAEAQALDRTVVVIAESDLNDPKVVRRRGDHGWGLDAQWSDDFHHAVHAALTGERKGYYADFGGVDAILDAMREPFVYHGQRSAHRRRKHGAPSDGIPRERFVVAIQNHDQVGNRAVGDRLSTLVAPAQLRLAVSLLLLSPYVPLLFMGDEYGETNPFLYFVDHGDQALVEAVRKGRRAEFASFGWEGDVPDPQSEETFLRSRLDRTNRELPPQKGIRLLYEDLLALRRDEPMLRPDGSTVEIHRHDDRRFSMLRSPMPYLQYTTGITDAGFLGVFNCSAEAAAVPVSRVVTGAWSLRFTSEAEHYGGSGGATFEIPPEPAEDWDAPKRLMDPPQFGGRTVTLPAWSAALYQRTPS
jgi:maltooligosyltrehalose trehalohydrolase